MKKFKSLSVSFLVLLIGFSLSSLFTKIERDHSEEDLNSSLDEVKQESKSIGTKTIRITKMLEQKVTTQASSVETTTQRRERIFRTPLKTRNLLALMRHELEKAKKKGEDLEPFKDAYYACVEDLILPRRIRALCLANIKTVALYQGERYSIAESPYSDRLKWMAIKLTQ
jgi:hypothetical protein